MSSHVEVRLPAFFASFSLFAPFGDGVGGGWLCGGGLALAEKSTVKIIVPDLEHLEL